MPASRLELERHFNDIGVRSFIRSGAPHYPFRLDIVGGFLTFPKPAGWFGNGGAGSAVIGRLLPEPVSFVLLPLCTEPPLPKSHGP